MIQITNSHVRIVPQFDLILEAVHVGPIEARDAFTDLVLDAEILVDDAELQKIKALPDVQQAMGGVVAPAGPTYKTGDWRAKGSEMRTAQWKQKPVIDYVANTYKDAVMKAVADKMSSLPEQWRHALLARPAYRLESKGLQLSPTEDKKFKSIFVQVILNLEEFLNKLSQEFEQAVASGQVQEAADGLVWKSSLTGLDTLFKNLDPYAGTKTPDHFIHGKEVARWGEEPHEAEQGYDLHVKEGMMDQMQSALDEKFSEAVGVGIASMNVSDDGVFAFKANPPEPATEPERVADDLEEPPAQA